MGLLDAGREVETLLDLIRWRLHRVPLPPVTNGVLCRHSLLAGTNAGYLRASQLAVEKRPKYFPVSLTLSHRSEAAQDQRGQRQPQHVWSSKEREPESSFPRGVERPSRLTRHVD